jgi:hypothetical protein
VPDKLVVPFAGEGSGVGELTWGQQTVWRGIEARGGPITLTGVAPVAAGITVEDVAGSLAYMTGRHQSLRTRLRMEGGVPLQQVLVSEGETTLEIFDADDDADPLKVARAIETEWEFADHDYVNDWPMRMGVVRHRGVPVYRVTALCHLASDGFGVLAMLADLADRDPVTGLAKGPVTAMEPLEQARWQGSPAGQRQSKGAQRHWERLLQTIPLRRFNEPQEKRTPRYGQVTFNSPATFLAIQAIAARTDLDTSPVLLAAYAVAVTRATGINPAAPRVMVNNRFRPRLATTVSPLAQTCPCVIDVAGITFDEAVARAYRASVVAYKNAYFEPVRIRELLAAASAARGEEIDLLCVYNDRRMGTPRTVDSRLPEPEELRAALPLTSLKWENESDDPTDTCHIHILDSPDAMSAIVLFDSHYVSAAVVEEFLRGMEKVTVAAAFDPDVPTGI